MCSRHGGRAQHEHTRDQQGTRSRHSWANTVGWSMRPTTVIQVTDSSPSPETPSPSVIPGRKKVDSRASDRASRTWWDADADEYHRTHGEFLGVGSTDGEFIWCPEGLHEGDVGLLGDTRHADVLEVGCGSAPCARWLTSRGARAVGLDISAGMLGKGRDAMRSDTHRTPLIQASAESLPFALDPSLGRRASLRRCELRYRLLGLRRGPVRRGLGERDGRGSARAAPRRQMGVCRQPPDAVDISGRSGTGRIDGGHSVLRPHPVRRVRCRGHTDLCRTSSNDRRPRSRDRGGGTRASRHRRARLAGVARSRMGSVESAARTVVPWHCHLLLRQATHLAVIDVGFARSPLR